MVGRLENKVALISGTGSGMGRAAAVRFAEEGALIVGCDANVQGNKETVERVRSMGSDMVELSPIDVSDPAAAQRWVDTAIDAHGRIDVLYNNAGGARHGGIEAPLDSWLFTMRCVVDLVFYPTFLAWPYLKQSGGVIINTASTAAHRGNAGMLAYSAGKGAVIAMTRSLAAEGAPYGIRAYTISPGPVHVESMDAQIPQDSDALRVMAARTMMQRMGEPREVASLACFLASDEASFMTGIDIPIDGGSLALGGPAPVPGGGSPEWLVSLVKDNMTGSQVVES